jgi:hypothetical protein
MLSLDFNLKKEAVLFFEQLLTLRTAQRYNPQNHNHYCHRRNNIKSETV